MSAHTDRLRELLAPGLHARWPSPTAATSRPDRTTTTTSQEAPVPSTNTPSPSATPLVTSLAVQLGVNLADVTGSGAGGRITTGDVHAAAPRRRPTVPVAAPASSSRPLNVQRPNSSVPAAGNDSVVGYLPPVQAPPDDGTGWFPDVVAAEEISDAKLAAAGNNCLPSGRYVAPAGGQPSGRAYDSAAAGWFPGVGLAHIDA